MKLYPLKIYLTDDKGIEHLVATKVYLAKSLLDSKQGLIGMDSFPQSYGMLLYQTNAIHMRGVKFPIDVVYLDYNLKVIRTVTYVNPETVDWGHKDAYYTLELPVGTINFNPINMRIIE